MSTHYMVKKEQGRCAKKRKNVVERDGELNCLFDANTLLTLQLAASSILKKRSCEVSN